MNTLKLLLKNEKFRALISIILWIFFFIIMFAILNSGTKNSEYSKPTLNEKNYEYEIEFKINKLIYNIEGIRYEDKELIEIKELNKEYINDFSNIKELYNFDIKYLRLELLKKYIENNISTKEITYNDGSIKRFYEINNFKINDNDNTNSIIKMDVKSKNNIISEVNIDLTNKMKNINITNYEIRINYYNIGNIKDFTIE